ncbi:MAG: hypothetical protein JSW27_01820 [Phycisphaerales bacterium]|nr:MAG: hypothetical protein JSW27_01820 [Phycisphaerales bacterium]
MPSFSDAAREIAGESVFTYPELEKLFKTPQERDEFLKVRRILKDHGATNTAVAKIGELGSSGAKVLVKLAKYALTV